MKEEKVSENCCLWSQCKAVAANTTRNCGFRSPCQLCQRLLLSVIPAVRADSVPSEQILYLSCARRLSPTSCDTTVWNFVHTSYSSFVQVLWAVPTHFGVSENTSDSQFQWTPTAGKLPITGSVLARGKCLIICTSVPACNLHIVLLYLLHRSSDLNNSLLYYNLRGRNTCMKPSV